MVLDGESIKILLPVSSCKGLNSVAYWFCEDLYYDIQSKILIPLSLCKGLDSVALRFRGETDCGSEFFFLPQDFLFFDRNLLLSFHDFDFDFFVADLLFFFRGLQFVRQLRIRSLTAGMGKQVEIKD